MLAKIIVFVREFINFEEIIYNEHEWEIKRYNRMAWNEKLAYRIDFAAECAALV